MSSRQAVRQPLAVRERSSRTFEQRLAIGFPRLADAYARRVLHLPPTSRLVARAMRSTLAAYNRRDVEAYLVPFDREARYEIARQSEEMGLYEPSFPVHDGIGGLWEELDAAWGEVRIDPRELIDLGPHVVMLGKMEGQGVQSNAPVSFALATVSTLNSDGKVIRIREYIDHAEALEAVGLSE